MPYNSYLPTVYLKTRHVFHACGLHQEREDSYIKSWLIPLDFKASYKNLLFLVSQFIGSSV